MNAPFVGRGSELTALYALRRAAAAGQPSAAAIVAEPGLGKTRLLAEAAAELMLPIVRLQGYELAREIPLAAAGGLLRQLSAVDETGSRLEALLLGRVELARTGLEMLRVFETAFRCLVELGPLAVVADDVQWADQETLALFQYLLRASEPAGLPLLLVVASRPAAAAEAFAASSGGLSNPDRFVTLRLGPLARDEGIDLAQRLAPRLGRDAAGLLWEKAQGSPFWLEVLAAEDSTDGNPARLIRTRYASLEVDAAQLFALLIVSAQPLAVGDAADLLAWDEQRIRHGVLVLADRGLVVSDGGTVRIAHDLIREAGAQELPNAERRRLHRRLAAWLEARAGDNLQELRRALEHRQAAGLATVELALRIARSPQRRLLGSEGLAMLIGIVGEAVDGGGPDLQREVAGLAVDLGEWAVALASWAALADRLPARSERADAALAAARAAFRLERVDEAHAFIARARSLVPDQPLVAIEADVREAQVLRWLENRTADAQVLTDRATVAVQRLVVEAGGAESLGDAERSVYVAVLRAQLDAGIRAGDAKAVAHWADEIGASARGPLEALNAACDAIFSLVMFEGLPLPAESRARRALAEARQQMFPGVEVEATHWLGWTLQQLGQLEEAERLTQQAVALAERVGAPDRFSLATQRATAHAVSASRGDWRRGVAAIAEQIGKEPDPHFRLNVRMMHLPLLARFAGAQAAGELKPLLGAMADDAEAAGCERCRWQSILFGAEAEARLGDIDLARTALERWDAVHPDPFPGPRARRAYAEALVAVWLDPASSIALFGRAAELAGHASQHLIRLWIELDAGSALAAVDRIRAVEALRSVAQEAEAMGALSEQQLAVQRLRGLGVRTWRRRGGVVQLTARELQVAQLVASGASNPDIAGTLFLSRKTVERHVSNILVKLGAKNRTELASRLSSGAGFAVDGGAHR